MATSPSLELDGSPASALERRASARHACNLKVYYGSVTAGRLAVSAVVRDLSAGGIGLMVNEAVPRGTLVTIQMCSEAEGIVFSKSLRIKYARNEGTGNWSIGGSFDKQLTKKEMKRLLQETDAGSE